MRQRKVTEPVQRMRHQLGLTQTELGTICGLSARTVASVEEGGTRRVPRKILDTLSGLDLDCTAEEIEAEYQAYLGQRKQELLDRIESQRADKAGEQS